MCGCALSVMLLTLAVVLPTPHDCSDAFQGGYSARFIASRRVLREEEGFCTLQKQPRENTVMQWLKQWPVVGQFLHFLRMIAHNCSWAVGVCINDLSKST